MGDREERGRETVEEEPTAKKKEEEEEGGANVLFGVKTAMILILVMIRI